MNKRIIVVGGLAFLLIGVLFMFINQNLQEEALPKEKIENCIMEKSNLFPNITKEQFDIVILGSITYCMEENK